MESALYSDPHPAVTRVPLDPPKRPWTIAPKPTDYLPLRVIGSREPGSSLYQETGLLTGSFGVGFSPHFDCDR